MRKMTDTPRIYVASLADYNAGRLLGCWIDATLSADEMLEQVQEMLAKSREPFAEEWEIHDYENFLGIEIGEGESLENVSMIANAIADHGIPFALYAIHVDGRNVDESMIEAFADSYAGEWDSAEEYAQDLLEDVYNIPERLALYIDWGSVARDLRYDGCTFVQNDGRTYVFAP